jgi:predicted NBD/HSP70 family sugar kinase
MKGQKCGIVKVMGPTPRTAATSAGRLLELIQVRGGLSRRQLLAETGMSRGTLYGRLDALARLGFVYEAESLAVTGGRPARRLRFDDRGRVLLAVDLGQTHVRISVTDLLGTELRRTVLPLDVEAGPQVVLDPVVEHSATLLAAGSAERLAGLGIGVPAPVDPTSGAIVRSTWPGWSPSVVVDAFTGRWPVPVVVENDARVAAVGESRDPGETLVYVKLATGLGCGIVVDGEVLRGARGFAGDIGHVRVASAGGRPQPVCRCGRSGCLAAYSSGRALLGRLASRAIDSLDGIVGAAAAGDAEVLAELGAAAEVLGSALATTVTTVNPDRLVLGGPLGVLPVVVERVGQRIRADVDERAWPRVEGSTLGGRAIGRGLARLVVRRAFGPAVVDAALAAGAPEVGGSGRSPRRPARSPGVVRNVHE